VKIGVVHERYEATAALTCAILRNSVKSPQPRMSVLVGEAFNFHLRLYGNLLSM
jgi:hypothetical protein